VHGPAQLNRRCSRTATRAKSWPRTWPGQQAPEQTATRPKVATDWRRSNRAAAGPRQEREAGHGLAQVKEAPAAGTRKRSRSVARELTTDLAQIQQARSRNATRSKSWPRVDHGSSAGQAGRYSENATRARNAGHDLAPVAGPHGRTRQTEKLVRTWRVKQRAAAGARTQSEKLRYGVAQVKAGAPQQDRDRSERLRPRSWHGSGAGQAGASSSNAKSEKLPRASRGTLAQVKAGAKADGNSGEHTDLLVQKRARKPASSKQQLAARQDARQAAAATPLTTHVRFYRVGHLADAGVGPLTNRDSPAPRATSRWCGTRQASDDDGAGRRPSTRSAA